MKTWMLPLMFVAGLAACQFPMPPLAANPGEQVFDDASIALANLSGVVLGDAGNQPRPIPFAAIVLFDRTGSVLQSIRASDNGIFVFDQLTLGVSYRLQVSAPGWITSEVAIEMTRRERQLEVVLGLLAAADVEVAPEANVVAFVHSGRLLNLADEPVAGALVELETPDLGNNYWTVVSDITDDGGYYVLEIGEILAEAPVRLQISKGSLTVVVPLGVADTDSYEVEFVTLDNNPPDVLCGGGYGDSSTYVTGGLEPGAAVQLAVQANDADGDQLHIDWTVDGSSGLLANGPEAVFQVPAWQEPYSIVRVNVSVDDGIETRHCAYEFTIYPQSN